jgi:hypothetical protein
MEVEFTYSKILDRLLHQLCQKENSPLKRRKKESEEKLILFREEWSERGLHIIRMIEHLTKKRFKKDIRVYFITSWPDSNSRFSAISDPVIVTVNRPIEEIGNLLIHELIHLNIEGKYDYELLEQIFPGESRITLRHIIVHAILQEVLLNVYGKERLELDKKMCKDNFEFRKAWEIVENVGSMMIIHSSFGSVPALQR